VRGTRPLRRFPLGIGFDEVMSGVSGFNVCLPEPPGYGFSHCLWELCELLGYSLQDLGFETTCGVNRIEPGKRNIFVGCHLLDPGLKSHVRSDSIIVNTEQIYDEDPSGWKQDHILGWVRNFETWDYSPQNIAAFDRLGVPGVRLLQLGHQPQLARIPKSEEKDIDVLFYGSTTERRHAIFRQISEHGLKLIVLFGVFGRERDAYISRSKVVLNLHNHAAEIFEIVRVHYLLSNSVAVVSEVNASTSIPECYRDAVAGVPYAAVADECVRLVHDDASRKAQEDRAISIISRFPQTAFTKEMLT
jgi:hypothetical protein